MNTFALRPMIFGHPLPMSFLIFHGYSNVFFGFFIRKMPIVTVEVRNVGYVSHLRFLQKWDAPPLSDSLFQRLIV